jgi:hypothetical protein
MYNYTSSQRDSNGAATQNYKQCSLDISQLFAKDAKIFVFGYKKWFALLE